MNRILQCGVLLVSLAALSAVHCPAAAQATGVAIVVHPSVAVDDLSFEELRRIFRGERQEWPDKARVTLLVRAPVAAERRLVLERIYRMSEDGFRQFWIQKMFRADVASGPKIVYSSEMARELVTAIPGAITFIPVDAVTPGLKVLRIDGQLPGAPTYPLK